ncbi:MAG: UDP-glucose 4-epimerase GalE [Alphaproteobacteria bacterium]|nr:UDP-glucose 4-epimerase GalE [Alphaproteobacteria bacterium]
MKVLVIGGAGYIGSHVTRELLDNGHDVTVFDNLSTGTKENLFSESNFIQGDILNYSDLIDAMKNGFDAVLHFAAFKAAGESMIKPEKYSTNNISGTINILNAMSESGIKNIIFSSSAAVYGEPEYVPIDEKHPKNPENYYGFTKLEIERISGWYEKLKGFRFAALRYFNAAGYDTRGRIGGLEKGTANLLPLVMEVAAGTRPEITVFGDDYPTPDGTCIRDYIHVSDLANGHLLALNYIIKNDKSLTLNLGTGNGTSVKEIIDTAKRITGKEIKTVIGPRRDGDPAKLTASANMAYEILGWIPKYSDIDTLIESTWAMYNK